MGNDPDKSVVDAGRGASPHDVRNRRGWLFCISDLGYCGTKPDARSHVIARRAKWHISMIFTVISEKFIGELLKRRFPVNQFDPASFAPLLRHLEVITSDPRDAN